MLLVASTIFCDTLKQTDKTFAPSGSAHTASDTTTKYHWCYLKHDTGRRRVSEHDPNCESPVGSRNTS